MSNFDVILHYEWVHQSCIHKYLNFNKLLNNSCNCLLILNNGKLGLNNNFISIFGGIESIIALK